MKERFVEFLSEQYNKQKVSFNIADLDFVSEATATTLDELITKDFRIDTTCITRQLCLLR